MYLRNGYCIEYDMFAPDFWNQYNNLLCEIDKDQQANLWIPFRRFINELSDSWNNVASPSSIGVGIFVIGFLLLGGLIWLTWYLVRLFLWREKKPRKVSSHTSSIARSISNARKGSVSQAATLELRSELFRLMSDNDNGATPSSLLSHVNRILDENGRFAQSVEAYGVRGTLIKFRDELTAKTLEEQNPLEVAHN